MASKLLLIHNNVKDYNTFIDSSLDDTECIVLGSKDLPTVFKDKLSLLSISNLTHLGIIFENTSGRAPFFEYTQEELEQGQEQQNVQQTILGIPAPAFAQSGHFFSDGFLSILAELKDTYNGLSTLDIISCNIQSTTQFDDLLVQGITVRYSTNITGVGGDWILESHNVNVTPIYFTEAISNYPYRLGGTAPPLVSGNYVISLPDHLYWLMTYTSNNSGTPNLSNTFILSTNIDMSGYAAESIGKFTDNTTHFNGIFNGQNSTITITNTTQYYFGLFGLVYNNNNLTTPLVSNTRLNYSTQSVTITDTGITGSFPGIGGFIGTSIYSIVVNCLVTFSESARIIGTITTTQVGGFIGYSLGYVNNHRVSSCSLSTLKNITINSQSNAGGFIGYNEWPTTVPASFCSVTSLSNVSISGTNSALFIGNNNSQGRPATTSSCSVTVSGDVNLIGISSCGGFIGYNSNNVDRIVNCSLNVSGNVTMYGYGATSYVGGFIGSILNTNSVSTLSCSLQYNKKAWFEIGNTTTTGYIGGFTGYHNTSNALSYSNCSANYSSNISFDTNSTSTNYASFIGNLKLSTFNNNNSVSTLGIGGTSFFYSTTNSIVFNQSTYTTPINFNLNNNRLLVIANNAGINIITTPGPTVINNLGISTNYVSTNIILYNDIITNGGIYSLASLINNPFITGNVNVNILAIGGGGGGAAGFYTSNNWRYGGGGGGSGQEVYGSYILPVTTSLAITIGVGGSGGVYQAGVTPDVSRGGYGSSTIVTSSDGIVKMSAMGGNGASNNSGFIDYGGNGYYGGGVGGFANGGPGTGSGGISYVYYPFRTGNWRYIGPYGSGYGSSGGNGDGPAGPGTGGVGGTGWDLTIAAGGGGGGSVLGAGGNGGQSTSVIFDGQNGINGSGGGGAAINSGTLKSGSGGRGGDGCVRIQITV